MNESIKGKKDATSDTLVPIKFNFNSLVEQPDYYKDSVTYKKNVYYVNKYSENSEEYTHIKKIVPLQITPLKRFIYHTLNIITFGIINLFMKWFPTIKKYIRYSVTNLLKANYFGVYGMDGEMNIKKVKKIKFPEINLDEDSIIPNLKLNLQSMKFAIMFDYKSYDYIYNEKTKEFEILDYGFNCPKNKILNKLSSGLYPNEVEFLKLIFGKCDIDIKMTSMKKILLIRLVFFHIKKEFMEKRSEQLNELSDPFYLFQLYSVTLWILTEYYLYSFIVILLTLPYS